jgi:signal transduction histidine kinase
MKLRVGGLHLQLLGLIILPFSLVLLAVALAGIRIHQQAMRQLVAERDERSARAAAAAISEQLHHRESAVRGLALHASEAGSPVAALADSSFLFPDFDGGLAIFDPQGRLLASSIPAETWSIRPLHPWFASLVAGQSGFSEPFAERGEGVGMVGSREGETVILGVFSMRSLLRASLLETVVASSEASAYLVSPAGLVLASVGPSPPEETLSEHPGVQAALRGEIGSHFLPAADGEHVVAFSPVQPTGWALVLEEPWQSVISPALQVSQAAPLVLVPGLLVTLMALWFGARQVIRPLRRLQQQAEELTDSEYPRLADPVGGIAEIQQLQASLSTMAARIQAAHQALQSYIGSITLAQEEERRRLARELHDATIQDLIAIDHRVQILSRGLQAGEGEAAPRLDELRRELNRSIQELRRLTGALRPMYLEDLGLVPALDMLAKEAVRDLGVNVSFDVEGHPRRLGPEAELAVFRIVQEALNNISRHATATKAIVRLRYEHDKVVTQIQDDGGGFDPPEQVGELAAQGHYGLLGMHERAQLAGAQLKLESAPGKGTLVTVELPVATSPAGEASRAA